MSQLVPHKRLNYPTVYLKPPNLHTYPHQLLGFTIVSRQDAIMRFNVVLFVIISCGFELAVFIHGQHYYYPVAPPSLHCLKKHCDQIVTGKVIIHKSRGEVSLVEQDTIECVSVAYLKFIFKFSGKNLWFSHLYSILLFSGNATKFFKK